MNDDDLSFIIGSTRRQEILLSLAQRKMTVVELVNQIGMSRDSCYRALKQLKAKGFVTHNDVKRYKIYRITDKGLELLHSIGVIK